MCDLTRDGGTRDVYGMCVRLLVVVEGKEGEGLGERVGAVEEVGVEVHEFK